MDAVTLYAIVTLASGAMQVVQKSVPAERCEDYAHYFRHKHPTFVIWCRSEIDGGGFISDHVPRGDVGQYVQDPMDMLGMPGSVDHLAGARSPR